MKLIIAISLLILSTLSFAYVTHNQTIKIYYNLIDKNKINNPPKFDIADTPVLNAYYMDDTNSVVVNQGMLNHTTKDELAWVLGHELGHKYYHHKQSTWYNEFQADEMGLEYSTKAGYSCKGYQVMAKFNQWGSFSHAPPVVRMLKLQKYCK